MDDDELVAEMKPVLEIDFQMSRAFETWDADGIAQFRRCGRRAVRELGYKAVTVQSDPGRRDDGRVIASVMIKNPSSTDMQRLESRGRLLINDAFEFLSRPSD